MTTELTLGVISFLTSTVAGVVGIWWWYDVDYYITIILTSKCSYSSSWIVLKCLGNFSRAVFGYKDVQFEVIPKFLLGSLIGICIFAAILNFISLEYVPIFIGIYILLSLWSQKFNDKIKRYETIF